jgi:hypothetical protein
MKYIVLNTYGDTFPSSFTGFIQGLGNTWLDVDSILNEEHAIRTSEIDKLIEVLTPGTNLVYFMGCIDRNIYNKWRVGCKWMCSVRKYKDM